MGTNKIDLPSALFSQAQQKVLGLLFGQPDKDFYTKEIIRLSQCGSGAIQRELQKLQGVGLITVKNFGNQLRYQANQDSPLFHEIRSIILKTFGLTDIIKHAIKPVTDKIQIAFIYGSVAKQEDHAGSDIDLMILSDKLGYAEIFPLLEKAEKQLHRTINPTFYTAEEWAHKRKHKNHFISQIMKQPKIYLIGNENELNQLG